MPGFHPRSSARTDDPFGCSCRLDRRGHPVRAIDAVDAQPGREPWIPDRAHGLPAVANSAPGCKQRPRILSFSRPFTGPRPVLRISPRGWKNQARIRWSRRPTLGFIVPRTRGARGWLELPLISTAHPGFLPFAQCLRIEHRPARKPATGAALENHLRRNSIGLLKDMCHCFHDTATAPLNSSRSFVTMFNHMRDV